MLLSKKPERFVLPNPQSSMSYAIPPLRDSGLNNNISEKIARSIIIWMFFSRNFVYPWVQSPLKEELHIGTWESFLSSPIRIWIHLLYNIIENDQPRILLFLSTPCGPISSKSKSSSWRPKMIGKLNMPTKRKHERELFSSRRKGKAMWESPQLGYARENSQTYIMNPTL